MHSKGMKVQTFEPFPHLFFPNISAVILIELFDVVISFQRFVTMYGITMYHLIVRNLRPIFKVHKPPGSSRHSSNTNIHYR